MFLLHKSFSFFIIDICLVLTQSIKSSCRKDLDHCTKLKFVTYAFKQILKFSF